MKKKFIYIKDLMIILALAAFTLADAFLIPKKYATAETVTASSEITPTASEAVITDTTYEDENISIVISTYRYCDTDIYVADVTVSDIAHLQSVFADDSYGRNITASTSEIAETVNAILAINGDFYGARDAGYVIRNGVLYRSSGSASQEDLVIGADGSFSIIQEEDVSAQSLLSSGALQVYSFGPALIEEYEISVSEADEVGKAKADNPRTAICEIEPLHYLFVVSDGRTSQSEGLSLHELAEFLAQFNVKTAYNLDGGGSSTMVFNGVVINNPTTSGRKISERSVSDIVCITA